MLNRSVELDGLEDWSIWWGGNLGRPEEELVSGRVGDVRDGIEAARERIRGSGRLGARHLSWCGGHELAPRTQSARHSSPA